MLSQMCTMVSVLPPGAVKMQSWWHRSCVLSLALPSRIRLKQLHACRDMVEAKQDEHRAQLAVQDAVQKDQRFARKVFYAIHRWHASWQLMNAFQRWTVAIRLRRVRTLD